MLILTRRIGESVRIGDDTVVTVLQVRRNQVRIGFDVPSDQRVFREEIWVKQNDSEDDQTDQIANDSK